MHVGKGNKQKIAFQECHAVIIIKCNVIYETLLCTHIRNTVMSNMLNDEDRDADRDRDCVSKRSVAEVLSSYCQVT